MREGHRGRGGARAPEPAARCASVNVPVGCGICHCLFWGEILRCGCFSRGIWEPVMRWDAETGLGPRNPDLLLILPSISSPHVQTFPLLVLTVICPRQCSKLSSGAAATTAASATVGLMTETASATTSLPNSPTPVLRPLTPLLTSTPPATSPHCDSALLRQRDSHLLHGLDISPPCTAARLLVLRHAMPP